MSSPSGLSWAEVAPALAFDAPLESIVEVALQGVPTSRPADGRGARHIENAIDACFVRQYGPWASGWRWAGDEGSIGGGPVQGWCCPDHSIWTRSDRSARDTAKRAASGLLSWRDWIRELAQVYARVPPASSAVQAFERHALEVLQAVMERTSCGDAWYVHAAQVLSWFLESQGHERTGKIVGRAMKHGRFESWSGPTPEEARSVAASMRDEVFRQTPDVTAVWWKTRSATAWLDDRPHEKRRMSFDVLLEHTVTHDASIDEARGEKMLEAMTKMRERANDPRPLTVDDLRSWQESMGIDSHLRIHDAYAKDGRERYTRHGLEEHLAKAVEDVNDERVPPVARAARAYLDMCFLHPFVDGNARAARLLLDFVYQRHGLALFDEKGTLFKLPLSATAPDVGASYLSLLQRLTVSRE